jgi:hypothetical protein
MDVTLLSMSDLLALIREPHRPEDRPRVGSALRLMYWRYSFELHRANVNFHTQATQFIQLGGIHLLLCMVVTSQYTLYLNAPSDASMSALMLMNDDDDDASSGNIFSHWVLDAPFSLPPEAMRYDAMQPIGHNEVQMVTLRRLALEILSEMTNYQVYRESIGSIRGGLPSLMAFFQAVVQDRLHQGHMLPHTQRFDDDMSMFMLDRLVNAFANLAFDGKLAYMTDQRDSFYIQRQRSRRRQGWFPHRRRRDPALIPEWDDINDEGVGHVLFQSNRRHDADAYHHATDLMVCYMMHRAGPWMLDAAETVHHCAHTLRNMARFFCNTSQFLNDRIFYRLAAYDPVPRLVEVCQRLSVLVQEPEQLREQVGVDALEFVIQTMRERYHDMYLVAHLPDLELSQLSSFDGGFNE